MNTSYQNQKVNGEVCNRPSTLPTTNTINQNKNFYHHELLLSKAKVIVSGLSFLYY